MAKDVGLGTLPQPRLREFLNGLLSIDESVPHLLLPVRNGNKTHIFSSKLVNSQVNRAECAMANLLLDEVLIDTELLTPLFLVLHVL